MGKKASILVYLALCVASFTHCDADRSEQLLQVPRHRKSSRISKINSNKLRWIKIKHFEMDPSLYSSSSVPYGVSSPFSLPPYDSLSPENSPPLCLSPPNTPLPPPAATSIPTPGLYTPPSGPSGLTPNPTVSTAPSPPQSVLSPPLYMSPGPPYFEPSPPLYMSPGPPYFEPSPPLYMSPGPPYFEPSPPLYMSPGPPYFEPSPPSFVPSPTGFLPSPPIFEPPVVFPPPRVPHPPPNSGAAGMALWCVAKPSVPDPIIEEAMNYACGSGADCGPIQAEGPCFQPNTFLAHASYAFNSFWQMRKAAGGNCEFGGTAILVSIDPSECNL